MVVQGSWRSQRGYDFPKRRQHSPRRRSIAGFSIYPNLSIIRPMV